MDDEELDAIIRQGVQISVRQTALQMAEFAVGMAIGAGGYERDTEALREIGARIATIQRQIQETLNAEA